MTNELHKKKEREKKTMKSEITYNSENFHRNTIPGITEIFVYLSLYIFYFLRMTLYKSQNTALLFRNVSVFSACAIIVWCGIRVSQCPVWPASHSHSWLGASFLLTSMILSLSYNGVFKVTLFMVHFAKCIKIKELNHYLSPISLRC